MTNFDMFNFDKAYKVIQTAAWHVLADNIGAVGADDIVNISDDLAERVSDLVSCLEALTRYHRAYKLAGDIMDDLGLPYNPMAESSIAHAALHCPPLEDPEAWARDFASKQYK